MRKFLFPAILTLLVVACATTQQNNKKQVEKHVYNPDSAKVWYSIARDYAKKAEIKRDTSYYRRAVINYYRSLYYDKNFEPAYLGLAKAYIGLGMIDSAKIIYNKVLELNPSSSKGYQGLGFVYGIIEKNYPEAEKYYKKAIEIDPSNADAYFGLAKLYEKEGKSELCDTLYEEAIRKKPDFAPLLKSAGLFYKEKGEIEKSTGYLEKALEVGVSEKSEKEIRDALLDNYIKMAQKTKEKNKKLEYYQKAVAHADTLIQLDSTKYTFYLRRATAYEGIGDVYKSKKQRKKAVKYYRLAEADYKKAIQLASPNNPLPSMKLASLYIYSLKNYGKAKELLNKVLSMQNLNDAYKYWAYFLLGEADYRIGYNIYSEGKKKKDYKYACDAVTSYDKAKADYNNALKYASDPAIKSTILKRLDALEKSRKLAYRVCHKIATYK